MYLGELSPYTMHTSLHKILRIILGGSAGLTMYGTYKVLLLIYREWTSPLRVLPGPPNSSLLWGNMKDIIGVETPLTYEKWLAKYGSTITYRSFFGTRRLITLDTKAINHILMNDKIYQKPVERQYALTRVIGHGLLVVEGDKHRQQRRIMNPAFGAAQIRELTDIFVQKSIELRDVWLAETAEGRGRIEVMSWLSRMTLDVIGLAGFNYEFNALSREPKSNELNNAFSAIFRAGTSRGIIPVLRNFIPALRWLPAKGDTETRKARTTMYRIGEQLLADSKLLLNASSKDAKSAGSRDLLSLLLRANTNADLPASQRMTDKEVLDQVPTFLVAGHETTSTATTWALYALTQSPEVQDKLREELVVVSTDTPSMDELNNLSYLDWVVREVLRLYAPVPATLRTAVKDDVLPLSEPIRDSNGVVLLESIPVRKGQTVFVPILVLNRSKEIWGEDSMMFKPERWSNIPKAATHIPGVWGNMLTFLGGTRACIGYRFSLVEMKALLFTLIRAFEFELAVPASEISSKTALVRRPALLSDPKGGNQMPLYVTRYRR